MGVTRAIIARSTPMIFSGAPACAEGQGAQARSVFSSHKHLTSDVARGMMLLQAMANYSK